MSLTLTLCAVIGLAAALSTYATRCRHAHTHPERRGGEWYLRCRDCGRRSGGVMLGRR